MGLMDITLHLDNAIDYVVLFVMAILVIIGIYQFYFWCQRNHRREPRSLQCRVDDWFTLRPMWIWIYSGIYYPIIIVMIFSFKDMRHFNYTCISFVMLLLVQMAFFVWFPVQTPDEWREQVVGDSLSHRFIRFVQSFDKSSNCFPSMHVSVSTLTAMHLQLNFPFLGSWVWTFPVLIALSALYTKQHYVHDLLPGALVGYGVFHAFLAIYQ